MSDTDELEAFRLADSFLPVGTFTVSYGLEQFIQSERIESAEDLESLLRTYLERLVGPGELVALRAAHAAASDGDVSGVCTADRRLNAATLAAELRKSATHSGERLLRLQLDVRDDEVLSAYADRVPENTPGTYAAVLGTATAREGVPERRACLLHCHAFITGLLGAAQRLMSLGHTKGQRILTDLAPSIRTAVDTSADRALNEITSFAPLVDVLSAEHERAERRLFVS